MAAHFFISSYLYSICNISPHIIILYLPAISEEISKSFILNVQTQEILTCSLVILISGIIPSSPDISLENSSPSPN